MVEMILVEVGKAVCPTLLEKWYGGYEGMQLFVHIVLP